MFESLSQKLTGVFSRLSRKGALSEADVVDALREVRVALLEADVALPVVKDFIDKVKERAIGQEVLRSITPGQQVIKIVHDNLVALLGTDAVPLTLNTTPPSIILMLGLQGSGKTTTSGKLARRLSMLERKKVLLASLDTRRPAAQEQLAILAQQVGVDSLPIIAGQTPLQITARAVSEAQLGGYDVLLLDSAGRLSIDTELMDEISAISALAKPHEQLLVLDAMTGQDALGVATRFHEAVGVTGLVLTRLDGDARAGAALSLTAATGRPIKFLGVGEKLDALEAYHPQRLANRILGMGDVVALVEKAAMEIDKDEAEALTQKALSGQFDLNDLASQLKQMRKMGGLSGMLGFMPGGGALKQKLQDAKVDNNIIQRQEAIISSMTKAERRNPDLLNASRKRRVALGSGTDVAEINRLLKQYVQMRDMMKQVKKMGKTGRLGGLMNMLGGGGANLAQLKNLMGDKTNRRE